jgi:Protein of unknown function (DUF1638)
MPRREAGARPPAHIISCAVVAEELEKLGVPAEDMTVLEFGLHVKPEDLKEALREEIARSPEGDILLGYGLCSNAVTGLSNPGGRLIAPRADDCIALFLGSRKEHLRRLHEEPGTYFLTKGWIEASGQPFDSYEELVEKYGPVRAERIVKVALRNYTRLAFIDTGLYRIDEYRALAKEGAERFGLRFEVIPGSGRLLEKLLDGDWDEEFVVVDEGVEFTFDMFMVSREDGGRDGP